jgi:hypothetical protein
MMYHDHPNAPWSSPFLGSFIGHTVHIRRLEGATVACIMKLADARLSECVCKPYHCPPPALRCTCVRPNMAVSRETRACPGAQQHCVLAHSPVSYDHTLPVCCKQQLGVKEP